MPSVRVHAFSISISIDGYGAACSVTATIRQYLRAGLIDEMHLALAPVLLGSGERLFPDLDLPRLGYRCTEHVSTPEATHLVVRRV